MANYTVSTSTADEEAAIDKGLSEFNAARAANGQGPVSRAVYVQGAYQQRVLDVLLAANAETSRVTLQQAWQVAPPATQEQIRVVLGVPTEAERAAAAYAIAAPEVVSRVNTALGLISRDRLFWQAYQVANATIQAQVRTLLGL